MERINVNGKDRKVVGYVELTYKDALTLFVSHKENVKLFGWAIAEKANQNSTGKAFKVWENASDWGCVLKFQQLVRAYKDMGKRPKMVRFVFTREDVYMVNSAGNVIL